MAADPAVWSNPEALNSLNQIEQDKLSFSASEIFRIPNMVFKMVDWSGLPMTVIKYSFPEEEITFLLNLLLRADFVLSLSILTNFKSSKEIKTNLKLLYVANF